MSKVIYLETRARKKDNSAEKLVQIAREIDDVVVKYLQDKSVDPRDLVGLLSHRLGTLMSHLEAKDELWFICEKVLKRQAQLDSSETK